MMILASNPKLSLEPFDEALRKVKKEFNGWEILAEKYHGWRYEEEIKDALSTSDLEIQVHAPLNDINIASINPGMRESSMNEVKKTIEMADSIGSDMITVHPGLYSPLSIYWDHVIENSKNALKELNGFASEYNVTLAMENLPEMWLSICSTAEETEDFLDELDIKFCLDIGHAYTTGELDDFLKFSPINVHIHDNLGEEDVHLKLGEGEIDLKKVLRSLDDYNGNLVIEGRDMSELVESKSYLKELLDELG
ncbi:MAG: sugar phosphate isomerase/epimerase family protein [Thermoplasmata archaeon]